MPKIFISYRHSDEHGANAADRLAEALKAKFGEDSVFYDVESLPPGAGAARALSEAAGSTA